MSKISYFFLNHLLSNNVEDSTKVVLLRYLLMSTLQIKHTVCVLFYLLSLSTFLYIGTSVSIAVSSRSGSQLARTLVDHDFHHSFLYLFLFSVIYFSHKRIALVKKLFSISCSERPKT